MKCSLALSLNEGALTPAVPDGARLLWAAATYPVKAHEPEMHLAYALIGTLLLTGGRQKEVTGLATADVQFNAETITFQAHPWHKGGRLKTEGSERTLPLWPQLSEILEEYVETYRRRLPGETLFPSPHLSADRPLTDLRDLLDRVAVRAGFLSPLLGPRTELQERTRTGRPMWTGRRIRTRLFRQTYCAARLQTLDHGRPVSLYTVAQELGHSSEEMVRRVYARFGKLRHRSDAPEFRPEQWFEEIEGRLVPRQALSGGLPSGQPGVRIGVPRSGFALFFRTGTPPQSISPYGSVAQLDRALASGADESAADSAK